MGAVGELKQMAERKVFTDADARAYLLRVKLVLASLSPADIFTLEMEYNKLNEGRAK